MMPQFTLVLDIPQSVDLEHEFVQNGIILTAPSEKLQQFAMTYAEDKKIFSQTTQLLRNDKGD